MRGKIDGLSGLDSSYQIADDAFYLKRMKQILEAFPTKGPPYSAIQVAPHIYIGNQRNADDVNGLERLGITHVLNMAGTRKFDVHRSPYPKDSKIKGYFLIPAEDHDHYDIKSHFDDAFDFLNKCRKQGGKALVHCNMGINRSGAVCAAYILHDERRKLLDTTQWLKQKRSVILWNRGFRRQLVKFARRKGLLDAVTKEDIEGANYKGRHTRIVSRDDEEKEEEEEDRGGVIAHHRAVARPYRRSDSDTAIRPLLMDKEGNAEPLSRHRSYGFSTSSAPASSSKSLSGSGFLTLPRGSSSSSASSSSSYGSVSSTSSRREYRPSSGRDKRSEMEALPENLPVDSFRSSSGPRKYVSSSKPRLWLSRSKSTSDASPECGEDETYAGAGKAASPSPFAGFKSFLTRSKSQSNLAEAAGCRVSREKSVDSFFSTTRPLRVYTHKRHATDSELLQKPHSLQAYKRSETIATDNMGFEGLRVRDDKKSATHAHHHVHDITPRDRFGPATRSRASQSSRGQADTSSPRDRQFRSSLETNSHSTNSDRHHSGAIPKSKPWGRSSSRDRLTYKF